jgi:hypothetical protein
MTDDDRSKDAYERKFLEILLRHELPDDCTVRISVTPKVETPTAEAKFALKSDRVEVDSQLHELGLSRVVGVVRNW